MAFTNVWDDTFPPDTQLANQLGLDLRNFRLDAQQRMAAISGLDAAKPAFAADAQPANWNGILFFATDTGKIYQFNNPVWTDVTGSFQIAGSRRTYQNGNLITHTGDTTLDTIYTFSLTSPLAAGQSLRVKFAFRVNAQSAPSSVIQLFMNGTALNLATENFGSPQLSTSVQVEVLICAITSTTATMLLKMDLNNGTILLSSSVPSGGGYPNFTVKCQNGTNTDSQAFGPILAEII